jgi:hypothetical protein
MPYFSRLGLYRNLAHTLSRDATPSMRRVRGMVLDERASQENFPTTQHAAPCVRLRLVRWAREGWAERAKGERRRRGASSSILESENQNANTERRLLTLDWR